MHRSTKTYICDLGYHPDTTPLVAPPPLTPECGPHTPHPAGYIAHSDWADMMMATHEPRRCRGCGRYAIWEPKGREDTVGDETLTPEPGPAPDTAGHGDGGTVGELLAAARKARGWTLRDAEQVSGVPNAHISMIELGKIKRPVLTTLAALATAYGLPLQQLVEASGIDREVLAKLVVLGAVPVDAVEVTDGTDGTPLRITISTSKRIPEGLAVIVAGGRAEAFPVGHVNVWAPEGEGDLPPRVNPWTELRDAATAEVGKHSFTSWQRLAAAVEAARDVPVPPLPGVSE